MNEERLLDIGNKIAKIGYKKFRKILEREIKKLPESSDILMRDFIGIIIVALTTIDRNMLLFIRDFYQSKTNEVIDMDKLVNHYLDNVTHVIDDKKVMN